MTRSQYVHDNEWANTRERLALLERMENPATIKHMEKIGVSQGWNCLEVGAGGGSIAEWLCKRVGPTGRVLATDINTRFLDVLDYPNLQVMRHDIVTDNLPSNAFDFVHTRCLLQHISEREVAMQKMADAVNPGGRILVEEPDYTGYGADPMISDSSRTVYNKVSDAILSFMEKHGAERDTGAKVFGMLRSLGFQSIEAEGRTQVIQGASDGARFYRLTWDQLRGSIIADGQVTEHEFEAAYTLLDDPSFAYRSYIMMAAWGRKPQS